MYEINKVLSGKSLAWGEGFFHCLSGAKFAEVVDYVDAGKEREDFEKGWDVAMAVLQKHTDRLNGKV